MLKKLTVAFALTGLAAGAAYAGSLPGTGINKSLHDMNAVASAGALGGSLKDSLDRTCAFCHTPHNAIKNALADTMPLWNRALGTVDTTATPYVWQASGNATGPNGQIAISDPLSGPTRLCLSCHDGSIAYDTHGSAGPVAGTTKLSGNKVIKDFSITHPIGFSYQDALDQRGSGELVSPTMGYITSDVNIASFNTNDRALVTTSTKKINDTLWGGVGGIMTCASCHDVHNTTNVAGDAGHSYNYFLYAKEEGSAICLSCHVK